MNSQGPNNTQFADSPYAPLRHGAFRRIWIASLFSYFGFLINGVGAGWAMTELSGDPKDVALVQAAIMLPFMLFAIPAGALSDTYDRRKVSIAILSVAFVIAVLFVALAVRGLITPWLLLLFCFLFGTANAMFAPNHQASVVDQVPSADLPGAVALGSVSFNLARSVGPALGGILVAAFGSAAAFGVNALCYLPMLAAFMLWKRSKVPPRFPPEQLGSAIVSGLRYVNNSPPIRNVLLRCTTLGVAGGSITALMPLVARNILDGGPGTYGALLCAFGIGAVTGGFLLPRMRQRLPREAHIGFGAALVGVAVALLGFNTIAFISLLTLVIAGAAWMQVLTLLQVAIQTRAPRWVSGRAVASYHAAMAGGIACGSWLWGSVAQVHGTSISLAASGGALVLVAFLGRWLPTPPDIDTTDDVDVDLADPEIELEIAGQNGPVVVEIEYEIDSSQARRFFDAMLDVKRIRKRSGAYNWSLARDASALNRWIERIHYPTWSDYLRRRNRMTVSELGFIERHTNSAELAQRVAVRRYLEMPVGSLRP